MTVVARLALRPVEDGRPCEEIADAVDAVGTFDVSYETTLVTSVIEGPSVASVTAAARVAFEAVGPDWAVDSIEIDCQPDGDPPADDGEGAGDDDAVTKRDRPYV